MQEHREPPGELGIAADLFCEGGLYIPVDLGIIWCVDQLVQGDSPAIGTTESASYEIRHRRIRGA
ncbi:hypothetical protein AMK20_25105 [Streptomyces sp. TSRI0261]|nr:hypothetical protein AMK20_25105 [Streptomyces sp. TSRI0261]